MFKALVLEKDPSFRVNMRDLEESDLPDGDVTLEVSYSSLNYKDALAITNRSPVVRSWPMIPGIDGAGKVAESSHPQWKVGDRAIINGYGVGETHKGCLSQKARLRGDWLVPIPERFSDRQVMAIGTAGYTASLCVSALEDWGVEPGSGDILVTGASGGVGSIAIALLKARGFRVIASTGKKGELRLLRTIGADDIIHRSELEELGKPLQKERWAGVVDVAGGATLANACAQTRYGGVIAACGLAQSGNLPASMMPFILRGVALVGIDSVMAPAARRLLAWQRLARDLDLEKLEALTTEVGLRDAPKSAELLMKGMVAGRIVVRTGP